MKDYEGMYCLLCDCEDCDCDPEDEDVDTGPMAEHGDDYEVSRDEGRYFGD